MDNDVARHELAEALALVQGHIADLSIVEKEKEKECAAFRRRPLLPTEQSW